MSKENTKVIFKNNNYILVKNKGQSIEDANAFLSSLTIRGLSPRTIRAYAYDLLIFYRWFAAYKKKKTVKNLQQSDLLEFVRMQRGKEANAKSINRRLVVVGLLYRFLTGTNIERGTHVSFPAPYYKGVVKDRYLGINNIRISSNRTLRVKTSKTIVEPLNREQVRLLINSLKRYRDSAIVYLMLLCGLRSREVLNLKTKDVNYNDCSIRVTGKGGSERILPMPTIVSSYILKYLRLERPTICKQNTLFVILQGKKRGSPMTGSGITSLFRQRRLNKKIEIANPHRLRHTFGSDMARCGVQLPVLQKIMGHSNSSMTLQYINLSMSDIANEYQRAVKVIQKRYTKNSN